MSYQAKMGDTWASPRQQARNAARPEPEPVAYLSKSKKNYVVVGQVNWNVGTDDWIPLYTAPPQREWVGLTDEEIIRLRHLYDPTAHWSLDMFARVIEAKLKEKNNA